MPIDEGVNVDLQFLILEVRKQARESRSMTTRPTAAKRRKIRQREDYIDNLKNTLENKSYYNIHQLVQEERQLNYFKALLTIGSNLERCGDFFASIAEQMTHVQDPANMKVVDLRDFYAVVEDALDLIYTAFADHDLDLAQRICDFEQELDELYKAAFVVIRRELRRRRNVDDMLSLLDVTRYLERAGDSFLNIGEAILDIHVGEKMGVKQFRHLRRGLSALDIDISDEAVEFKSIMNTRSGSRVARVSGTGRSVFYKEGERGKIDEEVVGLRLWQKHLPGMTPTVLWHSSRKNHSTILVEYIEGQDLMEILINRRGKLDRALTLLTDRLETVWTSTRRNRSATTRVIRELDQRKADIKTVHGDLFEDNLELEARITAAKRFERGVRAPFTTLVHGDFNADNIIFQLQQDSLYYVDVHRSTFGDYAQDVAVFLVSNFRVPIFSRDIRKRLNEANTRVYECAADFAAREGDDTFDARLALGLFRSLMTSTRFLFDKNFSSAMFDHALVVIDDLLPWAQNPAGFKLSPHHFRYE